eukprot:CAMPEP_0119306010 /NCGR_PEP_ID=MMETSP1333-20130426/6859_1 /TAXON_ID=418940 /ORGANISM="Scyphosphaera apsteinii, Strain RCC1455" /LENGTH=56 /DNA_ID=CAMNT_0007309213 /DNA_START=260 /DNA_END=427 /DNA_ORIENTATION=+
MSPASRSSNHAKAHAVFASACGLNACNRLSDASASAANSVGALCLAVANAHAVFAS